MAVGLSRAMVRLGVLFSPVVSAAASGSHHPRGRFAAAQEAGPLGRCRARSTRNFSAEATKGIVVTVISASEIRLELSGADEPKVLAAPKRVTRPRPRQSHLAAAQPNTHSSSSNKPRLSEKLPNGLLDSYALRARGSEVMPPYDALVGSGPSYCIGSLCSTVRLLAPGHAQVRARVGTVRERSSSSIPEAPPAPAKF